MDAKTVHDELDRIMAVPRIRELYVAVRARFLALDSLGHDWEHVRRVVVNAAHLCKEEGANPDIVVPAAILHDIGFVLVPSEPKAHHVHGSKGCFDFLGAWTSEQRDAISSCILKHKGRYPGYTPIDPTTIEEKVVCDADQLEKMGWIGFLQVLKVYIAYSISGYPAFKTLRGLARGFSEAASIELYTAAAKRVAEERRDPSFAQIAARLGQELSVYDEWKDPAATSNPGMA